MMYRGMALGAVLVGSLLSIGCESADSTAPAIDPEHLRPSLLIDPGQSDCGSAEAPCFDSYDEVPRIWLAEIKYFLGKVRWSGSNVVGETSLDWFGNRLEMTRTISVDGSSMPELRSSGSTFWPHWQHYNPGAASFETNKDCGQTGNMAANVEVKIVALIQTSLTVLDQTGDGKNFSEMQPDCDEEERVVKPAPPGGGTLPPPPEDGDCWERVAWFEIYEDGSREQVRPPFWAPCGEY